MKWRIFLLVVIFYVSCKNLTEPNPTPVKPSQPPEHRNAIIEKKVNKSKAKVHALLICISSFQDTLIPTLSADNDYVIVKNALKSKFDSIEITSLLGKRATTHNIRKCFSQFSNPAFTSLKSGDMLVIHISSHGRQISDDVDGDETLDHLDESIVCFNSPFDANGASCDSYLRDDEIARFLLDTRKILGPKGQLFLTIDACHSGSAYLGDEDSSEVCRLIADPFKCSEPTSYDEFIDTSLYKEFFSNDPALAPFIYFSACQDGMLAFECKAGFWGVKKKYGVLSFAYAKALENNHPTYNSLFLDIEKITCSLRKTKIQQTPQNHGNLQLPLFNNLKNN